MLSKLITGWYKIFFVYFGNKIILTEYYNTILVTAMFKSDLY